MEVDDIWELPSQISGLNTDITNINANVTNISGDVNTIKNTTIPNINASLNDKATKGSLDIVNNILVKKADKTYIDTLSASLASGSPKGIYSSLPALQSAIPSGNTSIYITSDNGNWNYWNGTAWVSGGTYQSTGIANGGVTLDKINNELIAEFIGKKISVTKLNTAETSMAYQFSYDVTGQTIIGVPLRASFDFYTQSNNVKNFDTVFWTTDDLNIGGMPTRLGQSVPVINGINFYDKTATSLATDNKKYLHAVIWVQHNTDVATDWYFRNFHTYLNGTELSNLVASKIYLAEGIATEGNVNYLPNTLATKEDIDAVTLKFKEYQSGSIFFTVPVNQVFDDCINTAQSTMQDSETFENVPCVLELPTNYTPNGDPVTLVMTAHGAGGTVTSTDGGEISNKRYLLDGGFAIFDVNGGSIKSGDGTSTFGEHMGASRALQAYRKAYEWIRKNYNINPQILVHGGSMGGLTALNFVLHCPSIVKACSAFFPVTDLYNQAWLHPWLSGGTTLRSVAKEYNFNDKTGTTWEGDKVIGYNPINNNSVVIGDARYNTFPVPLKIWHGTADTAVDIVNTRIYVQALKNGGSIVSLREVSNQGHTFNDTMNQENLMWLKRWDF